MSEEVYDQVLAQLGLGAEAVVEEDNDVSEVETHRQVLLGLAQSGLLLKLGIKRSESQLKKLTPKQIDELWTEYENRYSACVSDDLISNLLYAYSRVCKWLVPDVDAVQLSKELTDNFVISAEIKNQLGRLGRVLQTPLLALANMAVITGKNVHSAITDDTAGTAPAPAADNLSLSDLSTCPK